MSSQQEPTGAEVPEELPLNADDQSPSPAALPNMNVNANEGPVAPGESNTEQAESLSERLARLEEITEIEFIRREARFIPSMINLWKHFRLVGGRKDARSNAALSSALWRVFSPGAAAAAGGGLLLLVLTGLQVLLVSAQNAKLDQQTHISEASRNTALAGDLGGLIGAINEEASVCIKDSEARVAKAVRCWRELAGNEAGNEERAKWLKAWMSSAKRPVAAGLPISEMTVNFLASGQTDQRQASLPLSPQTSGRVVALTNALRPYRFLDVTATAPQTQSFTADRVLGAFGLADRQSSPVLIDTPLSVERGLILSALLSNWISIDSTDIQFANFTYTHLPDWDFTGRSLRRLDLSHSHFECTSFAGTYLEFTNLSQARLRFASFMNSDATDATFRGSDLRGVAFGGAELPEPGAFSGADVTDASFDQALVTNENWIKQMHSSVAQGFEAKRWRLVKFDGSSRAFRVESAGNQKLILLNPKECRRLRAGLSDPPQNKPPWLRNN